MYASAKHNSYGKKEKDFTLVAIDTNLTIRGKRKSATQPEQPERYQ
jgi:hypothetical protein